MTNPIKRQVTISTNSLTIGYPKNRKQGENSVHENLSLSLYAGELTCLLGANGAGKSTLLRTLTGLQQPLNGEVLFNGKDIRQFSEQDLSTHLGLVLTDKTSVGGLTVKELVALGRYPYTGFFGRLSKKDNMIIEKAMEDVSIAHKSRSYVAELSDGERQKVMIAKALAQECPVIVLDEPTAFLDVVNRFEVMNLLHHLALTQNKTILLSTHDIELALLLADRLWLLSKNKGLMTGVTEDIVLSDSINDYIADGNIVFDKHSGRFVSKESLQMSICLEAEGDLFYWTKNFLARNGYDILSDNAGSNMTVKVISRERIEFIEGNNENVKLLNSFESLMQYLK